MRTWRLARLGLGAAGVLAGVAMATNAAAAPTRYDITGTATGTLGGVDFTNLSLDLQLFGDPSTAKLVTFQPFGNKAEAIDPLAAAKVSLGAQPTATISNTLLLGSDPGGLFVDQVGQDFAFVSLNLPIPGTIFDLTGPLGPLSASNVSFSGFDVQTSLGELTISHVSGAAFSISGPSVPEPATWAMMIMGFGAVGAMARRRGTRARLDLAQIA